MSLPNNVVIFGAGDIAELVSYYMNKDSPYRVVAFTVDGAFVTSDHFCERPVVPFEEVAAAFPPSSHMAFAALSYSRLNRTRTEKCAALTSAGYKLCSYISSKAIIWPDTSIGEHCLILELNNIQPRATIGRNVFLWSGNHLGHHAVIEDNVFVAGHVAIGGRAVIGANSFIGGNAGIAHKVRVGARCLIGAGSLITRDTEDESVHAVQATPKSGVPSNRVRGL